MVREVLLKPLACALFLCFRAAGAFAHATIAAAGVLRVVRSGLRTANVALVSGGGPLTLLTFHLVHLLLVGALPAKNFFIRLRQKTPALAGDDWRG